MENIETNQTMRKQYQDIFLFNMIHNIRNTYSVRSIYGMTC